MCSMQNFYPTTPTRLMNLEFVDPLGKARAGLGIGLGLGLGLGSRLGYKARLGIGLGVGLEHGTGVQIFLQQLSAIKVRLVMFFT